MVRYRKKNTTIFSKESQSWFHPWLWLRRLRWLFVSRVGSSCHKPGRSDLLSALHVRQTCDAGVDGDQSPRIGSFSDASRNAYELMTQTTEYGLCGGRIDSHRCLRTLSEIHVAGEREVCILWGFRCRPSILTERSIGSRSPLSLAVQLLGFAASLPDGTMITRIPRVSP